MLRFLKSVRVQPAEEGWDDEVLHHQAAEIFGWLRQSDSQHVSQKLTPLCVCSHKKNRQGHLTVFLHTIRKYKFLFVPNRLRELYARYFSGLQSAGADINTFRFTVHQNAHFLYVNPPRTAGSVIRVRFVVPGTRLFPCNITFTSH